MSVPTGSAASSSTDAQRPETPAVEAAPVRRPRSGYLQNLALRHQAMSIRRQIVYGLVMGWFMTFVAGFLFFCVPSRLDWLWRLLMVIGLLHLVAAVVVPQALAWPERLWIAVARWQGWLIMTILLAFVYFTMIWPAAYLSRRRMRGFIAWDDSAPTSSTAWEPIDLAGTDATFAVGGRYRSLPLLLASVIGFFFRRGNYILLPIIILLIVLGLVLYFVQSSALAPFIYTLF